MAPRSTLTFACTDSGAVVSLDYVPGRRPALVRAVIFMPAGDTFWVAPTLGDNARPDRLAVRPDVAGRQDLRLAAQAAWFAGHGRIAASESDVLPLRPVGLDVRLEAVSNDLTLDLPADGPSSLTVVRVTGDFTVGSVFHQISGLGWLVTGSGPAASDAAPGWRAAAVFQDGSAVLVQGPASGTDGTVAARRSFDGPLRAAPVHHLGLQDSGRTPLRVIRLALGGPDPADVHGEIRHRAQFLEVARPGEENSPSDETCPWLSWSAAPFVFVRSGVTGLGLVDGQSRVPAPPPPAASSGLPDPY
jgi:hypothetical protein